MKFLLEFREPFWIDSLGNAGFVLSDEPVPTWWTQSGESKLLTGWLGGPTVTQRTSMSDIELIDLALQSLSSIFQVSVNKLEEMLVQGKLINWTNLPVSMGGYSYSFPNSEAAKKMLSIPIEETLFFAGEALYNGDAPGTVEAAFVTGQQAAVRILGS
jgi:monoamine oxidase